MFAWCRYNPEDRIVQDVCARLQESSSDSLRMFPSPDELEYAQGKLGDIRVLDNIADNAPSRWTFRPVTCDNVSDCRLGVSGVLKRTHSCGSNHVIVHPTASDLAKHLQCLSGQRRMSRRRTCHSIERWFHQEFVEGLRSGGEFRVFIVTTGDTAALRTRKGVVMDVVHTLELPDKEVVVTVLHPSPTWLDRSHDYNGNDLNDLKNFALYIFNALRNRSDWSTKYESLEIGVRLDIGVSAASDERCYFVNEITRIYEADFFAEWLAQPGTHICKAVSNAIEEVFMARPGPP